VAKDGEMLNQSYASGNHKPLLHNPNVWWKF